MKTYFLLALCACAFFVCGFSYKSWYADPNAKAADAQGTTQASATDKHMKLGAFSMSLSVKDLATSKAFYEKLGFTVLGGGMEKNYVIMKNENALIGLFHGMFKGNILTFNPGWDENAANVKEFDDVRAIQKQLKQSQIQLMTEAAEKSSGPASLMISDPDGNLILVDQHR